MGFDAFTGGIEPGGLRTKNEIRILVCYLLASVDAPLSKDDIIEILVENGLANYFEVAQAIEEMSEKRNIQKGDEPETYIAGESGRMIASLLDSELPSTVREKAVCAAMNLLAKARRERENHVDIQKVQHGYRVACHISGGDEDLMTLTLSVPDRYQANMVKKNFQRMPEEVYRMMLALVTGNLDMAAGILSEQAKSHS